jgi:hypothetical protein
MVARMDDIDITPAMARAVESAMRAHGLTHKNIRGRGGPSSPTMTKILTGEGKLSADAARRLEDVLGWEDGSISRTAQGKSPVPKQQAVQPGTKPEVLADFSDGIIAGIVQSGDLPLITRAVHALVTQALNVPDYHLHVRLFVVQDMIKRGLAAYDLQHASRNELELAGSSGTVQPSATVGDQATAGEESQDSSDDEPR